MTDEEIRILVAAVYPLVKRWLHPPGNEAPRFVSRDIFDKTDAVLNSLTQAGVVFNRYNKAHLAVICACWLGLTGGPFRVV